MCTVGLVTKFTTASLAQPSYQQWPVENIKSTISRSHKTVQDYWLVSRRWLDCFGFDATAGGTFLTLIPSDTFSAGGGVAETLSGLALMTMLLSCGNAPAPDTVWKKSTVDHEQTQFKHLLQGPDFQKILGQT